MTTVYNPEAPNEGPTLVQPPRLALFKIHMALEPGSKIPCWYARTCLGCCWYEDRGEIGKKWGGKCHHPDMVAKYEVPQCLGLRYGQPHVTPESCPMLLVPDAWRERIPASGGQVS